MKHILNSLVHVIKLPSCVPVTNTPSMSTIGIDDEPKVRKGCLELVIGPMFSGKSTELRRRIERMKAGKRTYLPLTYAKDNRFTADNEHKGATHSGDFFEARKVHSLDEVSQRDLDAVQVVVLDEAQFFVGLVQHVKRWQAQGKDVILAALNGTYLQENFPEVVPLYPLAAHVQWLTAICTYCQREAFYSKRLTECRELEEIGNADKYAAVCADCL
jgi:thymidine kinase